jgi:hypothetical protein
VHALSTVKSFLVESKKPFFFLPSLPPGSRQTKREKISLGLFVLCHFCVYDCRFSGGSFAGGLGGKQKGFLLSTRKLFTVDKPNRCASLSLSGTGLPEKSRYF